MLIKKTKKHMGESVYGWLYSLHHFSFADYYDEENMGIGPLRVINDDIIAPHRGFDIHPHKNMEILTYVLDGAITHMDTIYNEKKRVSKGSVQYMSAGTGLSHSEYNEEDIEAKIAQIWVTPDKNGYKPLYGQVDLPWEDRVNKLMLIASGTLENAPISINNDVNIYALFLEKDQKFDFVPLQGYGYYIAFFQGRCQIKDYTLEKYEALIGDENILISSISDSHFMIFEIQNFNLQEIFQQQK